MRGHDRTLRTLGVAVAVVACAWFALGIRQSTSLSQAEAIIGAKQHVTASQARAATSLLNHAGTLNPDRQVDIDRVHVLLERNHVAQARRLAAALTHAEPQNIEVWLWLARAEGGDPKRFLRGAPACASARAAGSGASVANGRPRRRLGSQRTARPAAR